MNSKIPVEKTGIPRDTVVQVEEVRRRKPLAHPTHVAALGILQITVPMGSDLIEDRILNAAGQPTHVRSIEIDVGEREAMRNTQVLGGWRRRRRDCLSALIVFRQ
jgi:hypothetical protein